MNFNIPESDIPYPYDWPPKEFYANRKDATLEEMVSFVKIIERDAVETEIDNYITHHPTLLPFLFMSQGYSTGHHHSWIIPKKVIKTKRFTSDKGEIPDFLVAATDSDGFNWFVVELKGSNSKIFSETKSGIYFSSITNKGLNQIMEYLLTLERDQAYLRDTHRFKGLKSPRGILLIGREQELIDNDRKQQLKSAWNNQGRINIRTFDTLKRILEDRIELIKNPQKNDFLQFDPLLKK